MNFLWSKMGEADGILLSVPCYFLEATAVVKQLIDRAWVLAHQGTLRGKYASVTVPYATSGWIPYAMRQPNIFFAILGFQVIHRAALNVQGLAEAVHHEEALQSAHRVGTELAGPSRWEFDVSVPAGAVPDLPRLEHPGSEESKGRRVPDVRDTGRAECRGRKDRRHLRRGGAEGVSVLTPVSYNHFTYHIKPSRDYLHLGLEGRTQGPQRAVIQALPEGGEALIWQRYSGAASVPRRATLEGKSGRGGPGCESAAGPHPGLVCENRRRASVGRHAEGGDPGQAHRGDQPGRDHRVRTGRIEVAWPFEPSTRRIAHQGLPTASAGAVRRGSG